MSKSLAGLKDQIIVIYLDDLTVFSKKRKNRIEDLRKVLQRYWEHRISLNPKKSIFNVTKEKLLGHKVSEEGIRIDSKWVEAI